MGTKSFKCVRMLMKWRPGAEERTHRSTCSPQPTIVLAWYHAIHSHISQPFTSYVFLRPFSCASRRTLGRRLVSDRRSTRRVCNRPYHETSS